METAIHYPWTPFAQRGPSTEGSIGRPGMFLSRVPCIPGESPPNGQGPAFRVFPGGQSKSILWW